MNPLAKEPPHVCRSGLRRRLGALLLGLALAAPCFDAALHAQTAAGALLAPATAPLQSAALAAAPASGSGAPGLTQMAASLAVVVGLLLVSSKVLRRLLGARLSLGQQNARLRLTQTLPLGNRRFLSLVEVDGQGLLLGISGDRIEMLHVLEGSRSFQLPEEEGA